MFAHVPFAPPVYIPVHDWQMPVHAVAQQRPSSVGQMPLWHWLPLEQGAPFGRSVHAPAPLHVEDPEQSLSGFVPAVTAAHVPVVPPVLLAMHAEHVPRQGRSQQTPSCGGQLPDWH